jgi:hypothetical protein
MIENLNTLRDRAHAMAVAPITITRAKAFVKSTHRHLPDIHAALWAVSVWTKCPNALVGVALVGFPSKSQMTETNQHLRVLRVAVMEGYYNGCSMLLAACWKTARAMGCQRMDTHTRIDEPGGSLVAAGWIYGGMTAGGHHKRTDREFRESIDPRPKHRWWAPGSRNNDGSLMVAASREE